MRFMYTEPYLNLENYSLLNVEIVKTFTEGVCLMRLLGLGKKLLKPKIAICKYLANAVLGQSIAG